MGDNFRQLREDAGVSTTEVVRYAAGRPYVADDSGERHPTDLEIIGRVVELRRKF